MSLYLLYLISSNNNTNKNTNVKITFFTYNVLTLFVGGGVVFSSSECSVFCAEHRSVFACGFVIEIVLDRKTVAYPGIFFQGREGFNKFS